MGRTTPQRNAVARQQVFCRISRIERRAHARKNHLAHGANLRYVQELLGHESIQTTVQYTRDLVDEVPILLAAEWITGFCAETTGPRPTSRRKEGDGSTAAERGCDPLRARPRLHSGWQCPGGRAAETAAAGKARSVVRGWDTAGPGAAS